MMATRTAADERSGAAETQSKPVRPHTAAAATTATTAIATEILATGGSNAAAAAKHSALVRATSARVRRNAGASLTDGMMAARGAAAISGGRPRSQQIAGSSRHWGRTNESPQPQLQKPRAGAYIFPDPDEFARRTLRLDKFRMFHHDEREHHHHQHECSVRQSPTRVKSAFPRIERPRTASQSYNTASSPHEDAEMDYLIDSERLFSLTIDFLDKHGLNDSLMFAKNKGNVDACFEKKLSKINSVAAQNASPDLSRTTTPGPATVPAVISATGSAAPAVAPITPLANIEARVGNFSGSTQASATAGPSVAVAATEIIPKTKITSIVTPAIVFPTKAFAETTAAASADAMSSAASKNVVQNEAQVYKMYVPEEMPSLNANRRSTATTIKFAHTIPDRDWLHNAFMRFITTCILQPDGSSGRSSALSRRRGGSAGSSSGKSSTSDEETSGLASNRSASATTRRSRTARSDSGAKSGVEGDRPRVNERNRSPNRSHSRARSGKSTRSTSSSTRSHNESAVIIQSRIYKPHSMTLSEAEMVRDFLASTAPFCHNRKSRPKTLSEWYLDNHGKDHIWNSKAFSVKRYIMTYLKGQSAVEEALQRRQRPTTATSPGTPLEAKRPFKSDMVPSSTANLTATNAVANAQRSSTVSGSQFNLSPQMRDSFFSKHPETIIPFRKTGFERTPDDIKAIFKAMRGIKAFKDLSDFILGQVCGVLKYQELENNRAVFRQGDLGTAWYIILSGSCSVQISKTGRIEDSFAVATIGAGNGFGDLALVNDKPRGATILTLAHCEFAMVEKADYNRIIKFIHEKEMKEKIYFLRKVPTFSEWPTIQLRQIGQFIKWGKYAAGATLQTEGQKLTEFAIIKTGECLVYQELKDGNNKSYKIKIGTLRPLEYFGEEGVMTVMPQSNDGSGAAKNGDAENTQEIVVNAKSTILAGKAGAEVAVISCFHARTTFRNNLTTNHIHDKTASDLVQIYRAELRRRAWEREKRAVIDKMVCERLRDPTMNASRLMTREESGPKIWHF